MPVPIRRDASKNDLLRQMEQSESDLEKALAVIAILKNELSKKELELEVVTSDYHREKRERENLDTINKRYVSERLTQLKTTR
jgi:hypothetical protein